MKKNISRLVSLLLVLLFAVSISACSKPVLDKKNPVTITLWHYYTGLNQIALENAIEEFNRSEGLEKGIIVSPVAFGGIKELIDAVESSSQGLVDSQPMPNIFSAYPDMAMDVYNLDLLCDLNDYFTEDEKAEYIQGFLDDGIFDDDKLMIVPIAKSTEILYVNNSCWQKFCAVSNYTDSDLENWESIYDIARDFYHSTAEENNMWSGKAFMGADSLANLIIIGNKQMGTDVIKPEGDSGKVVIDKNNMRRIFDVYYKGYAFGYFDSIGRFRSDDVKSGDLLAYVGSTSGASYFPTEIAENGDTKDIDFLAMPYPVFNNGEFFAIQQGAGMAVSKSDEAHQLAASIFLKWFTGKEQNIGFSMGSGYLPVKEATYSDELFLNTLNELKNGEKVQQNMADVYNISINTVLSDSVYAASPFVGSNDARSILEETFSQAIEDGREFVSAKQAQGNNENEILEMLELDEQFESWIESLTTELERNDITYEIQN